MELHGEVERVKVLSMILKHVHVSGKVWLSSGVLLQFFHVTEKYKGNTPGSKRCGLRFSNNIHTRMHVIICHFKDPGHLMSVVFLMCVAMDWAVDLTRTLEDEWSFAWPSTDWEGASERE